MQKINKKGDTYCIYKLLFYDQFLTSNFFCAISVGLMGAPISQPLTRAPALGKFLRLHLKVALGPCKCDLPPIHPTGI